MNYQLIVATFLVLGFVAFPSTYIEIYQRVRDDLNKPKE